MRPSQAAGRRTAMPARTRPPSRAAAAVDDRHATSSGTRPGAPSGGASSRVKSRPSRPAQPDPDAGRDLGRSRRDLLPDVRIFMHAGRLAPAASAARRAPSTTSGTGPAMSMTTAQDSWTADCHTPGAGTGTGLADGCQRRTASAEVKAAGPGDRPGPQSPAWPSRWPSPRRRPASPSLARAPPPARRPGGSSSEHRDHGHQQPAVGQRGSTACSPPVPAA